MMVPDEEGNNIVHHLRIRQMVSTQGESRCRLSIYYDTMDTERQ